MKRLELRGRYEVNHLLSEWFDSGANASSHIDSSVLSTAECRIFECHSHLQTKDWVVLHSLGLSNRGSKPYGEIDFVALIPRSGAFLSWKSREGGSPVGMEDGKQQTAWSDRRSEKKSHYSGA